MKKVISIVLTVLLMLSMVSVLFSFSASAETPIASAGAGGTATAVSDGDTTVFTATPYYGNTFAGWYADGVSEPVSESTVFQTDEYTNLTAKFNVYNQIVDGSFENGTAGQDYFNLYSGSNSGKNNTIADSPTPENELHGKKVLACTPSVASNTANYLLYIPVTVKKNTEYAFHISYYMPEVKSFKYIGLKPNNSNYINSWDPLGTVAKWSMHWAAEGTTNESAWSYMGNQSAGTIHAKIVNPNVGISADSWTDVWVLIDTGEDASIFESGDTAEIWMTFGTENNNLNTFYIDNVCFAEATESYQDVSVTADIGGCITAIGEAIKTPCPVVYFDTNGDGSGDPYSAHIVEGSTRYSSAKTSVQQYLASPYNDNCFKGWYDENDTLVSQEPLVNVGEHNSLTAKFTVNNQMVDGNFEAGRGVPYWQSVTGRPDLLVLSPTENGYTGKGLSVVSKANCLLNTRLPVTVKKGADYVLSYNLKINSFSATQVVDAATGELKDAGTPIFSHMITGSPAGDGSWGHWPTLESWQITIRNAEDYSKSVVYTGYNSPEIKQISFADIVKACGEGWYEFILEFNTGDDTSGTDGNLFETSDTAQIFMSLGTNFAVSDMVIDNVSFYEANYTPVFTHKENVRAVRKGIGTVAIGNTYSFTLQHAEGLVPTVTYSGSAVEAVDGVYSVVLDGSKEIAVSMSNDDSYPEPGKDMDGNSLTEYNNALYTKPVWEGDTVYHENAVFYTDRDAIKLTYPIDSIVSVRSFDLQKYYVEGVDYEIADGKLVRLAGSSIPVLNFSPLSETGSWESDFDGLYVTQTSGGGVYPSMLAITYKHSQIWADLDEIGYANDKQTSVEDELDVFDKLRNGEDVHIVFYGDSMTSGWSISGGKTNVYSAANDGTLETSGLYTAPYAPSWMEMFIDGLKAEYPDANITYENLSLGGKNSAWGLANFEARYNLLQNKNIDLFLIGWGINDAGGDTPADTFKSNEQGIIDAVRAKCPDVSVLLYGGNATNTDASIYSREELEAYESMLFELANENQNTAATAFTTVFINVLSSKECIDMFENNFNHANDFGCRIYAQVMLAAMSRKYTSVADTPEAPRILNCTSDSITLVGTEGYEYSIDGGATWQSSPAFTGLTPGTDYRFVQRVARTEDTLESPCSMGTIASTKKATRPAPTAPVLAGIGSDFIEVTYIPEVEYSLDGINWQKYARFDGLESGTTYTVYQRYEETRSFLASDAASATFTVPFVAERPDAPIVLERTYNSITLVATEGYEYSIDDGETWQSSPVFTGLLPSNIYSFIQRVARTEDTLESPCSMPTIASTEKAPQTPPSPPTLNVRGTDFIEVNAIPNGEYSLDGINWQSSPRFEGLVMGLSYRIYQRYAETPGEKASPASEPELFTTLSLSDIKGPTLYEIDGVLYYVVNGEICEDKTLVNFENTWYYVNGGTVCKDEALVEFYGTTYYAIGGKVDWSKNDLVKDAEGNWYLVRNGEVSKETTLYQWDNGKWYYIKDGVVSHETTLVRYYNTWYYVNDGIVDFSATTLFRYYGTWYYVKGGMVDFSATTLCNYYGTWYYVKGGMVDFSATTLVNYGGSWYYVKNGILNWGVETLVNYYGTWYYVKNSTVDFSATTLCNYYGTWYYVKGGVADFSATTLCNYYGTWYYVRGGVVDFSATTLVNYGGTWYYVKNGVLNWGVETLVKYYGTWYYVKNSSVNFSANLTYNYYGTNYKVVGGIVRF